MPNQYVQVVSNEVLENKVDPYPSLIFLKLQNIMLQIAVFCFTLGLSWGMEGGCPAKPGKV